MTGHTYLGPLPSGTEQAEQTVYALRISANAHSTGPGAPWHTTLP
ncbi:hypothetical protein ACH4ND_33260 [Streptomyces sp. NPDC017179]